MKYFRTYPLGMQLLLFLLLTFTILSSAEFILPAVIGRATGLSITQLAGINTNSPMSVINAVTWFQGISNLYLYGGSAFLFAYLTWPRATRYLGLRAPGKNIQLLLSVLLMVSALPVLSFIADLIGRINFGPAVKAEQAISDNQFAALMTMPNFASFLRTFLLLAITPAIAEELFFRSILLRFTRKLSRSMVMPVLFTAVVFSYSHSNIYGYLSIFLAGVLLAVIYNLTGSLWCSILAHMSFNGTQIVLTYFGSSNPTVKALADSNTVPYYAVAIGAVVFCICLYLLLKNKTPLPPNWTADYTEAELAQKEE